MATNKYIKPKKQLKSLYSQSELAQKQEETDIDDETDDSEELVEDED